MKICGDLELLREMAQINNDENVAFRSVVSQFPIKEREMDAIVRGLAHEAMAQVDCVACHNCCILLTAQATDRDVDRMSQFLGITPCEFAAQYTVPAALADLVLKKQKSIDHRGDPCALLKDGRCTVYKARPNNCRAYPLLIRSGFRSRLWAVVDSCGVCPIVSAVFDELKVVLHARHPD